MADALVLSLSWHLRMPDQLGQAPSSYPLLSRETSTNMRPASGFLLRVGTALAMPLSWLAYFPDRLKPYLAVRIA
jgi:hypothetical protein